MKMSHSSLPLLFLVASSPFVSATAPSEADYYTLTDVPFPAGSAVEVSALEELPDGTLAIGTRRGEIWMLDNPTAPAAEMKTRKYADGLHEILGLAYHAEQKVLYVTQRPEVTKVSDNNGDGRADSFETFYDGWSQCGDYHEYNFGSKFDEKGHLWTTLCLTGSFSSKGPWRGWCLRLDPTGKAIPTCGGVRSPGGMGFFQGDCFYTDNQGPWNGSSSIKHLKPGGFMGHDGGNAWYNEPAAQVAMGTGPVPSPQSKSRIVSQREAVPQLVPPAIVLPHSHLGQSASGLQEEKSSGKFGPFGGQLLVGDQCYSNVSRCSMEQVNGVWQGAAILLREGLKSGVIPLQQIKNGSLFAGGCDRGWGSRGGAPFMLHRIDWTGKLPFEMHTVKAEKDGFSISFTKPVAAESVRAGQTVQCKAWTYIYQSSYGSPEVDELTPKVTAAELSADGLTLRLKLDTLTKGHVHQLNLEGIKAKESGDPVLHPKAYYTLNEIPSA
jgi:hypothetical protein